MSFKINVPLLVILVLNSILCTSSFQTIFGTDYQKFKYSWARNPYFYSTIIIYIQNISTIVSSIDKLLEYHLFNLAVSFSYAMLVNLTGNPLNSDATSLMVLAVLFSIFLTYLNPFTCCIDDLHGTIDTVPHCSSCTRPRRLRRRVPIDVIRSVTEFDTDTLTESESTSRFDVADEETQTVVNLESKGCQFPNANSKHFLRGLIPVKLMERCSPENRVKVPRGICNRSTDSLNEHEGTSHSGEVVAPETSLMLPRADAGDFEVQPPELEGQQPVSAANAPLQVQRADSAIIHNIEDLISSYDQSNNGLSPGPSTETIVITEVPSDVATALQSMAELQTNQQSVKSVRQPNARVGGNRRA